jgi:hypothetical protein
MGHSLFVVNVGRIKPGTSAYDIKAKAEKWLNNNGFTDQGKFGEGKADYFTIGGCFVGCFDRAAAGSDPWDYGPGTSVWLYKGETGIKTFINRLGSDYACTSSRKSGLRKGDWLVAIDYHH